MTDKGIKDYDIMFIDLEDIKSDKILKNIIKKQQKEIKELKAHQIIFTNDYKPIGSKERKFISENKIKAKIKEIKNDCRKCRFKREICKELNHNNQCVQGESIKVLQSLLEE